MQRRKLKKNQVFLELFRTFIVFRGIEISMMIILLFSAVELNNKYDECVEIIPTAEQIENASFQKEIELKSISFGTVVKVFHVPVDDILNTLTEESDEINRAENNHSDLVVGVYEGEKF